MSQCCLKGHKFEIETNLLVWSRKNVNMWTSEAAAPPNHQRESCILGKEGGKFGEEEDNVDKVKM